MFFKRVFTKSLAHYSYVVGDDSQLVVIDPQPEVDIYLDIALKAEKPITFILETHRNEDFLVGSKALAELSKAKVYISDESNLDYKYGERIKDGQIIKLNDLSLKAIHTPGHTLGHMAYLLSYKNNPHMLFSGDALFYGDIGRFDFYGENQLEKMAGLLYDSIFNKLMPLGDGVILCPAHGSGSACGESIERRELSTLGYERLHNHKLQYNNREDFIFANKKMLFKPYYFEYMEKMNLIGNTSIDCNQIISFKKIQNIGNDIIVDFRDQDAFILSHIPNSIWVKKENILSFINWVVDREADISILSDQSDNRREILQDLLRIGYTGKISFLSGGIESWHSQYNDEAEIKIVLPKDYNKIKDKHYILDVRKPSEVSIDYGDNGCLIPIEMISKEYQKLEDKKDILVVCPSGVRSNIVVSYLKSKEIDAKLLIGGLDLVK